MNHILMPRNAIDIIRMSLCHHIQRKRIIINKELHETRTFALLIKQHTHIELNGSGHHKIECISHLKMKLQMIKIETRSNMMFSENQIRYGKELAL